VVGTRFAEVGLWAQIGALTHPDFWFPHEVGLSPERVNVPRRFASFGQAARTGRSYFQIGVENTP